MLFRKLVTAGLTTHNLRRNADADGQTGGSAGQGTHYEHIAAKC